MKYASFQRFLPQRQSSFLLDFAPSPCGPPASLKALKAWEVPRATQLETDEGDSVGAAAAYHNFAIFTSASASASPSPSPLHPLSQSGS